MPFIKLGTLLCKIKALKTMDFHTVWKWKMDAFLVETESDADAIIEMDLSIEQKNNIVQKQLINEIPAGFFWHQMYLTADGGMLWEYVRKRTGDILLKYYVNLSWNKIILLQDHTNTAGNLAFEYLGQIIPYCLLNHEILTFHGVLLEYNGYGIIISAASGVGKTTRARLWRDYKNALIINGDRATCQKVDGVWTGYGLPWSGTSGEQINRSVPLKALVVLERGEENKVRRMSSQESFGAVLPHLQCPTWDAELVGKAMELMDDFLQEVPILHFESRPDGDAIETLCDFLEEI